MDGNDRGNYRMRYTDPVTSKRVMRSTGTADRAEAEEKATNWQYELNHGIYHEPNKTPWEDFTEDYLANGFDGDNEFKNRTTLECFSAWTGAKVISDLDQQRVRLFAKELRERTYKRGKKRLHRKPSTIGRWLRELRAAARWAQKQEYLPKVPNFPMPKKSKGAGGKKGRAITLEEFERMLAITTKIAGEKGAESFKTFMWALWWSGLRLSEALALRWDYHPGGVTVDLDRSTLSFGEGAQKNRRREECPLAPEAVDFLRPMEQPTGYVFTPLRKDGKPLARDRRTIGRRICAIGRKAGVVVNPESGKCASAHDLRRSFGTRWAKRVMPMQLKALMRHANIATTMEYYAEEQAAVAAKDLRDRFGSSLGSTRPDACSPQQKEKARKSLDSQAFRGVVRAGVEPATPGFSVPCSTN